MNLSETTSDGPGPERMLNLIVGAYFIYHSTFIDGSRTNVVGRPTLLDPTQGIGMCYAGRKSPFVISLTYLRKKSNAGSIGLVVVAKVRQQAHRPGGCALLPPHPPANDTTYSQRAHLRPTSRGSPDACNAQSIGDKNN